MTIQDEITAQTRKTVKQAQDFTAEAIAKVTEAVAPLLPKVPSLDALPKPVEVVEKAFDLSEALLANARTAAVEAAKALTPEAAAAPSKPAKKASAKKPPIAAAIAE